MMDFKMSIGTRAIRNILTFLKLKVALAYMSTDHNGNTTLYLYHTVSIWITVVSPQPTKAVFNFSKLRP